VEHVLIRNHISEVANLTSAEFSALVNDCDRVEKLPGKKEQLHKAILNAKNHKRFRRDGKSGPKIKVVAQHVCQVTKKRSGFADLSEVS